MRSKKPCGDVVCCDVCCLNKIVQCISEVIIKVALQLCAICFCSKCENVVDPQVQVSSQNFCDRCECKWQRRNTTTIKVI